jgi:hypothetical protein
MDSARFDLGKVCAVARSGDCGYGFDSRSERVITKRYHVGLARQNKGEDDVPTNK